MDHFIIRTPKKFKEFPMTKIWGNGKRWSAETEVQKWEEKLVPNWLTTVPCSQVWLSPIHVRAGSWDLALQWASLSWCHIVVRHNPRLIWWVGKPCWLYAPDSLTTVIQMWVMSWLLTENLCQHSSGLTYQRIVYCLRTRPRQVSMSC